MIQNLKIRKARTANKSIGNMGFSGNSSVIPRSNFGDMDRKLARNHLLHIASAVSVNIEEKT